MKKILSFLFGGLVALTAAADTARPTTFVAHQADGTQLTLRMVGDEHFHYYVDVNSGATMLRDVDGNFVVCTSEHLGQLKAAGAVRRAALDKARSERLTAYQQSAGIHTTPDALVSGPHKAPGTFNGALTGTRRGLVILVNFAGTSLDLPYQFSTTRQNWDDAFNKVGYNDNNSIGSVHDYFYDQSYGKFDLEFDVVGPVTVSYNLEYYGKNSSNGYDSKPYSMIVEACKLVNSEVDFKNYDWDGDGEVDQVYVIYAGYGESSGADPNTIWPHENVLSRTPYGSRVRLDNVYINTYGCSNELCNTSGTIQTGIGTACHEFSHCIGFPDFYDIDYSGGFGMDALDIMCNGGHSGPQYNGEVPYGYTAYERWMAGWLEPKVLNQPTNVESLKSLADEPDAYIIYNDGKKNEYFLLENHRAEGWYKYNGNFIGGEGMIVTHVDFDQNIWTYNQPNDDPAHQRMTIIPAGGSYGSYSEKYKSWNVTRSDYASFTFPGSKHVRALTNESHFDCGGRLWNLNKDKTRYMNKPITEIEENKIDGSISFLFMADVDDGLRYTVMFDAGEGSVATLSATQQGARERIILPTATATVPDAHFVGWTTDYITAGSECPAGLMHAGTAYLPFADVTLHAVYATSSEGQLVDSYRPVTTLKKGGKYIFTNRNAAADDLGCLSTIGLSADGYSKDVAPTPISFAGETTTFSNPADEHVWMVKTFDDELVLYNGTRYLELNSADGMKLSDSPCYLGWDEKYGLYVFKSGSTTKYYLRVQSGKFIFGKSGSTSARIYAYEYSTPTDASITYFTYNPEGISSISVAPSASATYDLQGRRILSTSAHGITIQSGKKIIR